jgi:hypothetical protein
MGTGIAYSAALSSKQVIATEKHCLFHSPGILG